MNFPSFCLFLIPLLAPNAYADLLGTNLDTFAVLGAATVTNVPVSTIKGNVGDFSPGGANAIVGFCVSPGVPCADPQVTGGTVQAGTPQAQAAHNELITAINNLNLLAPGTLEPADLAGLTLFPGVYRVPAGVSNLTGTVTLDGQGNANAGWVFLLDSSLITSPGSVVKVINTGAGAGVYWDVRSSATIDTTTSFEGNILALASVTLLTKATIGCGRALAETGQVALDMNTISLGCTDSLGGSTGLLGGGTPLVAGSNGLSGGLTVPPGGGPPVFLPFAPLPGLSDVPEPSALILLCSIAGWFGIRMRRRDPSRF